MHNTRRKEDIILIEKYISGKASAEEMNEVEMLFSRGEDDAVLRQILESDWNHDESGEFTDKEKLTSILDRIHHHFRINEYRESRQTIHRIAVSYMKVAAILLLPLLLLAGIYFASVDRNGKTQVTAITVNAPLGSRVSFTLPDGTAGMLNSGSSISYSVPFNTRDISLTGEAWLEVKHDEKKPFTVSAGETTVRVVGTSLNISAYPAEDYVEVVLRDGKVLFSPPGDSDAVTLLPSERAVYRDGSVIKAHDDVEKYTSWTSGKLVFRSDRMSEVARRLERWYNVRIIIEDPELENYSFRATFEDDSVEEVLKFLAMTSPITYRVLPRQLLSDGTYEKATIVLKSKKQ